MYVLNHIRYYLKGFSIFAYHTYNTNKSLRATINSSTKWMPLNSSFHMHVCVLDGGRDIIDNQLRWRGEGELEDQII